MGAVRSLLLEGCLLCGEDDGGDAYHLLPEAATLLRRLHYSKLRVGICYQEAAKSMQVNFLLKAAATYSFESICWSPSSLDNLSHGLLPAWNSPKGSCAFATSRKDDGLLHKLRSEGWRIILAGASVDLTENGNLLFIEKLEELFIPLCRFNKMVVSDASITTIGYIMKTSREEDFLKRGAFPMCPTEGGLVFVPLSLRSPLTRQLQVVDAVLHKATDEIISIDPSTSLDFPRGITFSNGMQELERYVQDHPQCCIIDPLNNVYPLLDRFRIQQILLGLDSLNINASCRIRAPHFLKIDDFQDPTLKEKLSEANLSFPNIIKPQVACGVADAHSMALVFKIEDFEHLHVPLPAIVQEYVNHGCIIFKFYVLGEKVFHALKKSMPNADVLLSTSEENEGAPIIFDSLKSLPTSKGELPSRNESLEHSLNIELVKTAANWMRRCLDLTIFGFDVVIQEGSGDHVIVDVNYLPSFKEIPDDDAIPAFWDAIISSYETWKLKSTLPAHSLV
uniref:Inositol-tetrakisphosphate 1-kinase 6 n=1 Tax=Anthurium amnicola TaxID=1678845 RepID=A0A1D1XFF0_9ARAE